MNASTNSSNDNETTPLVRGLNQVSDVIGFYMISAVSVIGFFLNGLTLCRLSRSRLTRLNTTFYESIVPKIITDLVVCFFGVFYLNAACLCFLDTQIGREWSGSYSYGRILFISIFEFPALRISLLASGYADLALILNRQELIIIIFKFTFERLRYFIWSFNKKEEIRSLTNWNRNFSKKMFVITNLPFYFRCRVLYNKTTVFSMFTKKGRVCNFYIFAIVPLIPTFLMFYPKKIENSYYAASTEFGQTDNIKIYFLCIFLLENILPTTLLIVFSLIARAKFNERVRYNQQAGMVTDPNRLKTDEVHFSRMIMANMSIFIATRSFDLIVGLAARVTFGLFPSSSYSVASIISFLRQLAYLLLISAHAFSSLVYIALNSKLREIFPFRRIVQGQADVELR